MSMTPSKVVLPAIKEVSQTVLFEDPLPIPERVADGRMGSSLTVNVARFDEHPEVESMTIAEY